VGLIALFLGIILIVAAVRNSQGALFTALEADVPKFVIWAAAIIAVGAIGAIPGLKPVSRWLLALVIVVIIVNNYAKLTKGLQDAWQKSAAGDTQPVQASNGESGNSTATSATVPASNAFEDVLSASTPHPIMAQ
jgi:hypothetical protein